MSATNFLRKKSTERTFRDENVTKSNSKYRATCVNDVDVENEVQNSVHAINEHFFKAYKNESGALESRSAADVASAPRAARSGGGGGDVAPAKPPPPQRAPLKNLGNAGARSATADSKIAVLKNVRAAAARAAPPPLRASNTAAAPAASKYSTISVSFSRQILPALSASAQSTRRAVWRCAAHCASPLAANRMLRAAVIDFPITDAELDRFDDVSNTLSALFHRKQIKITE